MAHRLTTRLPTRLPTWFSTSMSSLTASLFPTKAEGSDVSGSFGTTPPRLLPTWFSKSMSSLSGSAFPTKAEGSDISGSFATAPPRLPASAAVSAASSVPRLATHSIPSLMARKPTSDPSLTTRPHAAVPLDTTSKRNTAATLFRVVVIASRRLSYTALTALIRTIEASLPPPRRVTCLPTRPIFPLRAPPHAYATVYRISPMCQRSFKSPHLLECAP